MVVQPTTFRTSRDCPRISREIASKQRSERPGRPVPLWGRDRDSGSWKQTRDTGRQRAGNLGNGNCSMVFQGKTVPAQMAALDGICPICEKESYPVSRLDRFFHVDGSENQSCWRALLKGDWNA